LAGNKEDGLKSRCFCNTDTHKKSGLKSNWRLVEVQCQIA